MRQLLLSPSIRRNNPEDAKWESHRKFIDLQYVINGEGKMGLLPLQVAKLASDYDADKDVILFGEQDGEYCVANPDAFFLFFSGRCA